MKKLVLAVLAAVFMAGAAFAAESDSFINFKVGLDVMGNTKSDMPGDDENTKMGFSVAAEYLFAANDIFCFGGGLEYVLPREIDNEYGQKISFLPVYVTVKANPIETAKEVFFKANIGYVVMFDVTDLPSNYDKSGGLYYAIGAGYEFPAGLAVDLTYGIYNTKITAGGKDYDGSYSKVGINVGYKFKL
ncbi:MAG: porin family protein [Endomicrobia bacterium]|nr:porin family protein [Endomicrobiia bacterium]MCL2506572.1 porin family protein [Endomicrobiia bacterium]MCL2506591.1 porin family protein [Endomicrobiia bacterium]